MGVGSTVLMAATRGTFVALGATAVVATGATVGVSVDVAEEPPQATSTNSNIPLESKTFGMALRTANANMIKISNVLATYSLAWFAATKSKKFWSSGLPSGVMMDSG